MRSPQHEAVRGYRKRQRQRGMVRVEVQTTESDASLIRALAAGLRGDQAGAREIRSRVREALQAAAGGGLIEMLVCDLPDEVMDAALERPRDIGRDLSL